MDSFVLISIIVSLLILALALRYKRDLKSKEDAFCIEKITKERYIIRHKNDPITFTPSMFQKERYQQDEKTSQTNFTVSLLAASNDESVLECLKTRLLEVLKLREVYETTLASSNDEQYRESTVMDV